MSQKLPAQMAPSQFLVIRFQFFPPIILHVAEVQPNTLKGFDLVSATDIALRITDGCVYGPHNWPPLNVEPVSPDQALKLIELHQTRHEDILRQAREALAAAEGRLQIYKVRTVELSKSIEGAPAN